MKLHSFVLLVSLGLTGIQLNAAEPLRVFIRANASNRGQEVHAHPRFLGDWTKLLTDRGMKVEGGLELPTAGQLAQTDVLVMYAQDGGGFPPGPLRDGLDAFLKRGGGLVVLHTATVPTRSIPDNSAHWKSVIGGSWVHGSTKWLEGPMALYYVDRTHPISAGTANFDLDDEIYYDMDLSPDARVLAAAYTPNMSESRRNQKNAQPAKGKVTVYDLAPQMWTYERALDGGKPYRAFVSIPGHKNATFNLPHYRAVLLRGIAWAGHRADVNEFVKKDELDSLLYPAGGPSRPADSLKQLVVHPEFKVSLVASEPLVNKVMNVDWDAAGRMWVAETPEYPDGRSVNPRTDYVQRWQKDDKLSDDGRTYARDALDRISILTDTNGDGVMDKKQVFADFAHGVPGGLERVTSFVLHKNGVIAAAAPDVWWLEDTNGDGVCDKATKLYTNLGFGDTHAVINNLRWGFDGWIYATHGYSGTRDVTSGDGSKHFGAAGSGVVRFKPDGSAFEQHSSKGGNTWGLQISWDNEVFWTQPTSGDLLMHVVMSEGQLSRGRIPGTTSFFVAEKSVQTFPLIPYDSLPYVQIDQVGRFTAAAGTVIYDGGSWPAAWNFRYFTTEPTINIVHDAIVTKSGVTYTAARAPGRETVEFIAGKDLWFRPIEVRTGPDGAVYVVDFYNQAVIHNDTRGPKHGPRNAAIRPDRDHYYARLWRVDHKDAQKLAAPNLAKAGSAELVAALDHANQHVRMNAVRLLAEGSKADAAPALKQLVASQKPPQARVAALWALAQLRQLDAPTLTAAANDRDAALRKNAMKAAAVAAPPGGNVKSAALKLAKDTDPRVRLDALVALASQDITAADVAGLVTAYPALEDRWSQAAFLGVASKSPAAFLDAAFASGKPELTALVRQLSGNVANSPFQSAELIVSLAGKPDNALKASLLESLAPALKLAEIPPWDAALEAALRNLSASPDAGVAAAALPYIAKWDTTGALKDILATQVKSLLAKLGDASLGESTRAALVPNLLGLRAGNPDILPAVTKLLAGNAPAGLKRRVIESLGDLADASVGASLASAYPGLNTELQPLAFNTLLRRNDWTLALVAALESGAIRPESLGPANMHRLRYAPNADVARRAADLWQKLRGDEGKQKDALIAKLTPEVEKKGSVAKGRELFIANCANCHQLGDLGKRVGPPLTGMGAHGPAELLGQIIDPNREVDAAFVAVAIETNDGEQHDGILTRENNQLVALANAAGEKEILKSTIKSRRSTGRSLMPEGLEALGAEALRDILAFMCEGDSRFRFVDLAAAFTANTRDGLYLAKEPGGGALPLARSGVIAAFGVPFNVVDPARAPSGRNIMVLKGGPANSYAQKTFPQAVEAKLGFAAKQLHFLGNVGGWAFPFGQAKESSLKVTVHYAGGKTEELSFKNGEDIADYIREVDVPESKLVRGIGGNGTQVRFASRKLTGAGVIEKLTFASAASIVAPTTLAVTADFSADPIAGAPAPAPAPAAPDAPKKGKKAAEAAPAALPPRAATIEWGAGTKVLLIGGGSSHDFQRFFNLADVATLKAAKFSVNYTESPLDFVDHVKTVDVLVLSVNTPAFTTPEARKALFDHVAAGKGLVLLHAGVWYNYRDWPEYNRELAGGGSRGHDRLGEYEVKVTNGAHPIMKGVPATFRITDELYYYTPDTTGTPIEILATATSTQRPGTYPQVFVVKHAKARIAGLTLGHDARAHDLPEFKTLLVNCIEWVKR
ncbi:MAG: c-type cytochrome [Verrucomicrobia bacterium]|nr:c-type cytochrome [Verrucomicrobiota bacterium]